MSKSAHILSWVIAVLATVACLGGIFIDGLYRDNALIQKAWFVNDRLTLIIAVPLLLGSLSRATHSQRAQLVWVSVLGYMVYNYAFYLFGAAFNRFFLIYVGLFSLSILALVFALSSLELESIRQGFSQTTPVRWLSGFMGFIALFLSFKEVGDSLRFVVSGQIPQSVRDFAHPTSVIFALDLSLIVPGMALAAVWLWQHRAWGYVLGSMMLMLATNYGLVLVVSTAHVALSPGGSWDPLLPFYLLVFLGGLVSCGLLLGNLQPSHPTSQTLAH